MNLSNAARIRKLVANLLSNPDLILPYLKNIPLWKKSPIELSLPWWSFRAIEHADSIFRNKRVFEYGPGGSTLRYGKIVSEIRCVEDSLEWKQILEVNLDAAGLKNVTVCFRPFDFTNPAGFAESAYLHAIDEYDPEIVVIDGQDNTFQERITCFHYVEPRMKVGGVIVVDDFWRYESLLRTSTAKRVNVHESVGPCRYGVTSTAFFYY